MENVYKKLILRYGLNPYKYFCISRPTHIAKGYNEFCGDEINLYLRKEKDKIKDVSFLGKSCAISTASSSLMIKAIENKPLEEVKKIFVMFSNMFVANDINIELGRNFLALQKLEHIKN